MKLHLGCFDQPIEGWHNTDVTPHLVVSRLPFVPRALALLGLMDPRRLDQHRAGVFREVRYLDVGRRFPFDDGEVEAVYSSHVLEHLPRSAAVNLVRESRRVLRPGGVFRIAVPDLDRLVAAYSPEDPDGWMELLLETSQPRAKNRHHWMYNAVSLRALLAGAGFREITRREYREGECPDVERVDIRPDSLFMEAKK
ncbi:MAG TPA: methyltransferase domain-containing protein [Longimicrobiales bacterium]|nr:methyltransferase domain-containing protein [Longimicrobiales bacterium]